MQLLVRNARPLFGILALGVLIELIEHGAIKSRLASRRLDRLRDNDIVRRNTARLDREARRVEVFGTGK